MDGYSPLFRIDRDDNGRGILSFVRRNIPCKLMESLYVEVNLQKTK